MKQLSHVWEADGLGPSSEPGLVCYKYAMTINEMTQLTPTEFEGRRVSRCQMIDGLWEVQI